MVKLSTHTCAATGCQHQIPSHLLMCMDHWRMVPVKLRRDVVETWKSYYQWRTTTSRNYYFKAVANAVAALATKQTKKNDDRAAVEGDLFAQPAPAEHGQLLKEEHGNNNEPGREPAEGGRH